MTDLVTALADTSHLSPFEGLPVVQTGIEIPGAAGGLKPAMSIEPQEFHKGQRVYVVLECLVGKVRFDPVDKDDLAGAQARVHVFNVENATMVDGSLVSEALDSQRERVRLAQEAAQGIHRLDLVEPDEEAPEVALARQHAAGVHSDGLREGCEQCEAEAAAVAEEAAEAPNNVSPLGRGKRK